LVCLGRVRFFVIGIVCFLGIFLFLFLIVGFICVCFVICSLIFLLGLGGLIRGLFRFWVLLVVGRVVRLIGLVLSLRGRLGLVGFL